MQGVNRPLHPLFLRFDRNASFKSFSISWSGTCQLDRLALWVSSVGRICGFVRVCIALVQNQRCPLSRQSMCGHSLLALRLAGLVGLLVAQASCLVDHGRGPIGSAQAILLLPVARDPDWYRALLRM